MYKSDLPSGQKKRCNVRVRKKTNPIFGEKKVRGEEGTPRGKRTENGGGSSALRVQGLEQTKKKKVENYG